MNATNQVVNAPVVILVTESTDWIAYNGVVYYAATPENSIQAQEVKNV